MADEIREQLGALDRIDATIYPDGAVGLVPPPDGPVEDRKPAPGVVLNPQSVQHAEEVRRRYEETGEIPQPPPAGVGR